jgi:hypothetical protein
MAQCQTQRNSGEQPGCHAELVRWFIDGREPEIDKESVQAINSEGPDKRRQKAEHRRRRGPSGTQAAGGD